MTERQMGLMRGLTAWIAVVALPAHAQQSLPQVISGSEPDIVVVDGRLQMPVDPQTRVVAPPIGVGVDIDKVATYADSARRAAACATRGRITSFSLLREVVDGIFGTPAQERAQDWLVRQTATCGEGAAIFQQGFDSSGLRASSESTVGILYRGAFLAETIKAFGPRLMPTAEQLAAPYIQQRFNDREIKRAGKRIPRDLRYFRVALCMVREQPVLATRLVLTDPVTMPTAAIQAHLIERARACANNPKSLAVDRYEFRAYIADALYRWILAVNDVDTLVPTTIASAGADRIKRQVGTTSN